MNTEQKAIALLSEWLKNEEVIDRTQADNIALRDIRERVKQFLISLDDTQETISSTNLELWHVRTIKQLGVFVDVFRTPNEWAYVLRSSMSGEVISCTGKAVGDFNSYRDALAAGLKAAEKIDSQLIH